MGKGKRLRAQRTTQRAAVSDAGLPFIVDSRTARELGPSGLADLIENLWAKDCQTCGWELGAERPTIRVDDLMVVATATLHHRRCQPALWSEAPTFSRAALTTYDLTGLLLPAEIFRSGQTLLPLVLLNPWLEQALLKRDGSVWRVDTATMWSELGLHPGTEGIQSGRPVRDARSRRADHHD